MATKPTKPEIVYDVEAIYLGERVRHFGKIAHAFRSAKGEALNFTGGLKNVYFGDSYLVSKDGSIAVRAHRCEKPTLEPTEAERLEYEAHKEMAKFERAQRRKALELKRPHKDITRAIELLRPFARSLDSLELSRFTGYLKNQLSKKVRK